MSKNINVHNTYSRLRIAACGSLIVENSHLLRTLL